MPLATPRVEESKSSAIRLPLAGRQAASLFLKKAKKFNLLTTGLFVFGLIFLIEQSGH